jgi:hypothetical protein
LKVVAVLVDIHLGTDILRAVAVILVSILFGVVALLQYEEKI